MGQDQVEVVRKQVRPTEAVHETVLRAVSAATGEPVLELSPLQTAINVDAMDTLIAASSNFRALEFQYMGFEVTAEPEQVHIREPSERDVES